MKRLRLRAGEWINRERRFSFTFEGREYLGYEGDTVSSALAASGVRLVGRSFKYHRPRGWLSLANHDVNAMFQMDREPNLRGDVVPLQAGMKLTAVNTFGGLAHDWARVIDWLSRLLPVGFYYKAFHGRQFPFWEKVFRRLTGLGAVDNTTPRLRTPKRYAFCDVLVIGAGPSGLSAALAAADSGAQVALADENPRLGGSATYERQGASEQAQPMTELIARVTAHPRITTYLASTAAGWYADHWVPLVEQDRITKMRARATVFASGAFEQPAVFRNNDLPGVMLASAAQRLLYRYSIAPGEVAIVLAANAQGYLAALDLLAHDIAVAALVDLRPEGEPGGLGATLKRRGVNIYKGWGVYEARARKGVLAAARLAPLTAAGGLDPERGIDVHCDLLLMSVGWAPALNLAYQAGMQPRFDARLQQFVPARLPETVAVCGRANGYYSFDLKCADGRRAGQHAAAALGLAVADTPQPKRPAKALVERQKPSHPYPIFAHHKAKNFIDFDEDLQLKDLENAAQEGYDNIELLKRFSTIGMGPSQGKHSNMNAIRVLARIRGLPLEQIGSTTARPMFHPVPMSHLAGRSFTPERHTPLQAQHRALDASFMEAGQWLRPEFYRIAGLSREQAIAEEVAAVRNAVGLIDVGTLGKIELHGPDAGLLLDRVYAGRYSRMKTGSTRYGLMLDESGVIVDDGVVAHLDNGSYYLTTTTSGSANVYRELQRLNTIWRLDVGIVNRTGQCGAINLAGRLARDVLAALTDGDLSEAAFPYLAAREMPLLGVASRLMRVGFVGELGYEIHAPADSMARLWDALMQAGRRHGIRAFGVEAQRVLRLEKGHLIVGQDTDGLTNPMEASSGWAVAMDKPFFVGQRSLKALAGRPLKQRLVGFRLEDDTGPRPLESHLVIQDGEIAGRVTSVTESPTLKAVIGLAYVAPALAEPDTAFEIRVAGGRMIRARVVKTPFYDPGNTRQKAEQP